MTYTIRRTVSVLCLAAALGAAALLPVSGYCENLRFVFMADSRGNAAGELINLPVLNAVNTNILALTPRPSFVVFAGDMTIGGCILGNYTFQAFKDAMAPLTTAGIALYTAMGNHELYNNVNTQFVLANQKVYQRVFHENPGNGPPGYEHLAYSFESPGGDAFFAVLDPLFLTADVGPAPKPNNTGTFDNTQLNWLAAQVAQTKATHKFLFTHGPYYYVEDPALEGGLPPDITYTKLWSILDNNRFDLYCCGHVHLYSRKTIDSSIAPNPQLTPPVQWRNNVVQLLAGTCGAPVVTNPPHPPIVDPTLWHISQAANTYYFSVVDISGSKVTVTSYKGNTGAYSPFDSFTINKNALAGVDLLLLD
ncbi:MAG: metallophosphoesterase family protein [Desulfobaccales bacterium]